MQQVEIFLTCCQLQCDGRAGVCSSLEEAKRIKCPFCTKNIGYQTVATPSSVVSGSFEAFINVLNPKTDINRLKCNFVGFSVLGAIFGKSPLEIKDMKINAEDVCEACEKLDGKELSILGWVWVKKYGEEEMAASGTYDLTVNEARQGLVHVVSLSIKNDSMSSSDLNDVVESVGCSAHSFASSSSSLTQPCSFFGQHPILGGRPSLFGTGSLPLRAIGSGGRNCSVVGGESSVVEGESLVVGRHLSVVGEQSSVMGENCSLGRGDLALGEGDLATGGGDSAMVGGRLLLNTGVFLGGTSSSLAETNLLFNGHPILGKLRALGR